ncbi:Ldh family oxidoreductase [Sulfitobacter sp. 1A12057]|uniref:Ldh family oxidoreductase n=1 Tax=Sulfitobacter sp. 1A12057 TaxID=3368567 RepID=UPI003745274A
MTRSFTVEELTAKIQDIFLSADFIPSQAGALARVIAAAERDGCKSHGIYRIEGCLRTVREGKADAQAIPQIADGAGPILRVDANCGFANAAFEAALPVLVERAKQFGIAAIAMNNCVHFAALWPEVEAVADQGLVGMAMCPSYSTVAPAGGTKPLLGTNPFAFGWPRRDAEPYVFDFATSVAARGEIEILRNAGKPLPEGWAIDAEGNPTTDPDAALQGAMLPFGGHKGSAISMMVELMAAAMIGDLTSSQALDELGTTSLSPRHGELILAFDPAIFSPGGVALANSKAEALFTALEAQGARLPSKRRYTARKAVSKIGIQLSDQEVEWLERFQD